jgi:ubiquinone/menaquinone biosynthesis C-methylase UbiE
MDEINSQNKVVYSDDKVCASYLSLNSLFPPEIIVVDQLKNTLKNDEKILDIGIGTGRTTAYLSSLTHHYIGVDYSANMISLAKEKFPLLDLREVDARDLRIFKEHEFDVVFFSYNGLDYVSHEDRLLILREIKRVLKNGGQFIFSTHNICYKHYDRFRMMYSGNFVRYLWLLFKSGMTRLKNLKYHVYTHTYSIITDPGHYYRLLTYYISPLEQIRQLKETGFSTDQIVILDHKGNLTSDSPESAWLYYVVKN